MSNLWLSAVTACAFILIWGTVFFAIPKHGIVVYNCSIAEISPDYPVEVKNECRKLNSGRI